MRVDARDDLARGASRGNDAGDVQVRVRSFRLMTTALRREDCDDQLGAVLGRLARGAEASKRSRVDSCATIPPRDGSG